jgi:hypothetical protein
MAWRRPSSWEIVVAYIEEGHRAYLEGPDPAHAVTVERQLGLSSLDGLNWCRDLEPRELIRMEPFVNALGAYRLAPRGQILAERLPDFSRVVDALTGAVSRSNATTEEKQRAVFNVREETYKAVFTKGIEAVLENAPEAIWTAVRAIFPSLPPDWRP